MGGPSGCYVASGLGGVEDGSPTCRLFLPCGGNVAYVGAEAQSQVHRGAATGLMSLACSHHTSLGKGPLSLDCDSSRLFRDTKLRQVMRMLCDMYVHSH